MARLNVNPTRMELTKLKKKLLSAKRGHKLLKDKRDELMRRFMDLIRQNQQLRNEVESAIRDADLHLAAAESVMQTKQLKTALMIPKKELKLDIRITNIMSVRILAFDTQIRTSGKDNFLSYGTVFTSCELDEAVKLLSDTFYNMIRLAETEKACQLLADEIEKTRRRVNALEHVMIPGYEDTIKYISMKLSENERSTISGLMKVKNSVLKKSHNL